MTTDSFTGYDLFLTNGSGDVVVQSFDLNGITDGFTTLTDVELAQAEIRTGRDISGDGVVGVALQSELFNPHNTDFGIHDHARYAYQSNLGMIITRHGFDVAMTPAPDLRRVSTSSSWEGPDAILLTSDANERFILEPTESIVGVNMLRESGIDGPAMDTFDGFDVYIKDANGGLRIEYFDSEGNNHPDEVFTVDANNPTQLLAAEIYSRFDLNQDGIIGVDLINELASGAPTDPGNTWYQGRNRFAYSSDQGIILTQQRLDVANPAPGDTTPAYSAGSYDLRDLPATNTDHNGPSAVLLLDSYRNQLNIQGTVVSALAHEIFDAETGQEEVDGFELFVNDAGVLNKLSFTVEGIQMDSIILTSPIEIRLAEIQTRTDLNNDDIVGAQIVELLSSGSREENDTGIDHYAEGQLLYSYGTEEGILVSQKSLAISDGINITDLRDVRNDFSSLEGPSQQLLTDFDGNFFAVDTDKELVVSKRISQRLGL